MSSSLADLADATGADRNRAVDFLRAAAILVVVLGHWLMAAVYLDDGDQLRRADLLAIAPWIHPLTWVLQVMPVFFLVGGYSNAISWRGARAKAVPYSGWLRTRLRRLTLPVLPLMLFWAVVAPAAHALGVSGSSLRIATMASLVPTWFLAAYVVVVSLTPFSLALWDRWRWRSVVGWFALGALVDWVSITQDLLLVGFVNYAVVWSGVHQLGYAWRDGALGGTWRRLLLSAIGLTGLLLAVHFGPYAVSMVGVKGFGVDNAYPTRVTMGLLGLMQGGLVMAAEPALSRWLTRRRPWMATIFVNARIMTIYLWHLTALGLVVAAAVALGGPGLRIPADTQLWWLTRPVWFVTLAAATSVLVMLLGRFEQPAPDPRPAPPVLLPVLALVGICGGLGVMADLGIATTDGRVNWWLPLVPVVASVLFGVCRLPFPRTLRSGLGA